MVKGKSLGVPPKKTPEEMVDRMPWHILSGDMINLKVLMKIFKFWDLMGSVTTLGRVVVVVVVMVVVVAVGEEVGEADGMVLLSAAPPPPPSPPSPLPLPLLA